ncbi:MAG TPA: hypothetical protein VJJ53_03190 [Candidatus Nanoarchaeia archaeon]|nr:hypothetical protein [Candidatus Nanoarchaeia archaeon]
MKKGVSPLIAWVLIIGLSLALAVVVGNFMKESAEETAESLIKDIEGGAVCNKLNINAEPLECNKASKKIKLALTNRGFLAIDKVRVRLFYSDNTLGNEIVNFNNVPLLPDDNVEIEVPIKEETLIKLQVVPIRAEFGCVDKKIELSQEVEWFVGGC